MSAEDAPGAEAGEEAEPEGGAAGEAEMELLRSLLARTLGLGSEPAERVLDELSLPGVARFVQSGRCRRVVCMVGAGISTAAGIPDFRSPGTGLYANLAHYALPYPEAIFDIAYFKVCGGGFGSPPLRVLTPPQGPAPPPLLHFSLPSPPGTPGAFLRPGQGAASRAAQTHRMPLLHAPAEGEGAAAALLHPEHRHPGAGGGAGARGAGGGARHLLHLPLHAGLLPPALRPALDEGAHPLVPRPQVREVPECGEARHRVFRRESPLALLHAVAVGLPEGRPAPHHGHLAAGPALRLPRQQGPRQHPPGPHQQGEDGAERPLHVPDGFRLRDGLRLGQSLQGRGLAGGLRPRLPGAGGAAGLEGGAAGAGEEGARRHRCQGPGGRQKGPGGQRRGWGGGQKGRGGGQKGRGGQGGGAGGGPQQASGGERGPPAVGRGGGSKGTRFSPSCVWFVVFFWGGHMFGGGI